MPSDDDSFPVNPDTDEYEALDFLVRHHECGFVQSEIADRTNIIESRVAKTMTRLIEKGFVKRSNRTYCVDPDQVDVLRERLKSINSVVQLFEGVPDDDAYAEEGWEDELPNIDRA